MTDIIEVNPANMQVLAGYLQKTLDPATRHAGTIAMLFIFPSFARAAQLLTLFWTQYSPQPRTF